MRNLKYLILAMINKKNLIFFLLLVLLNGCSFDNKTGIWGGSEKEKRRILELEKAQKEIITTEKIFSSEDLYKKEEKLTKKINLIEPKKNFSWKTNSLNLQNFIGNNYLPSAENIFVKNKVGKNKFSTSYISTSLLSFNNNLILSDDKGTIFSINSENGKTNWKNNVYGKVYKKINKILVFSIYKNNLYVADNIGYIYSLDIDSGEIVWSKNYAIPLKSNIKIFNDKIYLLDQNNKIICLNVKDGSIIWNLLTISSFIKSQKLLSLAISKEGNLFSLNSSADLYKIDSNTGDVFWSSNTLESLSPDATDFFISSEIVLTKNEVIFSAGTSFFSYDQNTGSINWEIKANSVGTPIIDGEKIFFVTDNGYFVILNKNDGKIISSSNILKILKKKKQNTKVTGFIMGSGKIYSTTLNGYLIVSSANSGAVEYVRKVGDPITTSPIIVNGKLYILTEDSRIFGFN